MCLFFSHQVPDPLIQSSVPWPHRNLNQFNSHWSLIHIGPLQITLNGLSEAAVCRCSAKRVFLILFAKFKRKHLCYSSFLNKFVGPRYATLTKKRLWHRYFSVNVSKFVRTTFFVEHLRWLLLVCE